MDISIFALITIMFFAMMSPGPDLFLLIRNGMIYYKIPALFSVLGICTGLIAHVSLSIMGIAIMISQNPNIYHIIKIFGACYLIYLGVFTLFRFEDQLKFDRTASKSKSYLKAYREGLFCNLLNPKVTLFILSIFTQIIDPESPIFIKLFYGFILIFEAFIVWSIFVFIIQTETAQNFINRFRNVFGKLFSILLIALGTKILFE